MEVITITKTTSKKEIDLPAWIIGLIDVLFIWWYLHETLFWVIVWVIIVFLIFKTASSRVAGKLVKSGVKAGLSTLFMAGGLTALLASIPVFGWIALIILFIIFIFFLGWSISVFIQMIPVYIVLIVSYITYHLIKRRA